MSQRDKSIIDFFTPDGQLREEAGEFEGLDLEPFIDKRSKVTPAFSSALMGVMQFDLENDVEVSFYRQPNCVYGEISYPDGIKTILFKCRQRKNLTGFIRKVLEIGSWDTTRVHTDFRIHADF